MTRDDVLRLAREAGVGFDHMMSLDVNWLERFAAMVAAEEREACAKACNDIDTGNWDYLEGASLCAAAIRARK